MKRWIVLLILGLLLLLPNEAGAKRKTKHHPPQRRKMSTVIQPSLHFAAEYRMLEGKQAWALRSLDGELLTGQQVPQFSPFPSNDTDIIAVEQAIPGTTEAILVHEEGLFILKGNWDKNLKTIPDSLIKKLNEGFFPRKARGVISTRTDCTLPLVVCKDLTLPPPEVAAKKGGDKN